MSISNVGELKTAIADWLNRVEDDTDLVPRIPDLITLAETEIRTDLDARVLRKFSTAADIDAARKDLPSDYGHMLSVSLLKSNGDIARELSYATQKEIAEFMRTQGDYGEPQRYNIIGKQIEFFPSDLGSGSGWQYQIEYYSHPALNLTVDTDTNDVLTEYPGLYLYGSLAHAAPFLEEDARIPVWNGKYNELVEKINRDALYSEMGTPTISMPR